MYLFASALWAYILFYFLFCFLSIDSILCYRGNKLIINIEGGWGNENETDNSDNSRSSQLHCGLYGLQNDESTIGSSAKQHPKSN